MVKKILMIIIIIIISQNIFIPISQAESYWDDIKTDGDSFIKNGKDEANKNSSSEPGINQGDLESFIDQIYNLLLGLGIALSVLIGAVLGIKFMMSSVEEQAKVKEMLLPYAIGCIVTFGTFGIWKIAMTVLKAI